jgi:transcriptional regulator GlxA family with amidase domain
VRVAFPIFPGAEELDLAGPWEAFALARDRGGGGLELFTVALTREPVRLRGGLRVLPDYAFSSEPSADAIVVPGGPGTREEAAARPVAAWLAARRGTPLVASVCTGALLLGQAGLLEGRRATTHSSWLELLRERHPGVEVVDGARVVDEGAIVTAGGITAGIDLGLHLVGRLLGEELAAEVASVMEYPSPKTPASASARSRSGE